MKKTFFALFFAFLMMACSKSEEEATQSSIEEETAQSSINDVVGVWEATADEDIFKGTVTLTLVSDKTFTLLLKGTFKGNPIDFPTNGSFKYEYPLLLLEQADQKVNCKINETKTELTIEHEMPLINGRILKKK